MGDPSRQHSVTVLHVSDMQFGQYHRFDAEDSLSRNLVHDLKRLTSEGVPPIDLVVLSGDLAERSRKSEYQQARAFVDAIGEHTKLPPGRFVIVPGNHDVNWGLCETYFIECRENEEDPEPPYSRKWRYYQEFTNGLHGPTAFTEERPYQLHRFEDLGVVVAALNSTIRETHQENEHYGWCGQDQLQWFAEQLRRETTMVRIGVLHHNVRRGAQIDDENLRDADTLNTFLGEHLDLLLHGHTHEGKEDRLPDGTPILAAGSVAVSTKWRPEDVPNQYQVLHLKRKMLIRWARQWDTSSRQWIADTRISRNGNEWRVPLDDFTTPGWPPLVQEPRPNKDHEENPRASGGFLDHPTDVRSFSTEAIHRFRNQLRDYAKSLFPPEISEWEFLRHADLMKNDCLTRTGVLLFGEAPPHTLPAATVRCVHYFGDSRAAHRDSLDLTCNVSEQIDAAHKFVASRVRIGDYPSEETAQAQPVYKYPMIAVRELIANAVVHRDYAISDTGVHIRLFSNRLDIVSPGEWFGAKLNSGPVLLSRLEGESRCRNLRLATALTWIKLVESEGSGIPVALKACRDTNAPEPTVRQENGLVTVTIYPSPRPDRHGTRPLRKYSEPNLHSAPSLIEEVPIFFLSYARIQDETGRSTTGHPGLDNSLLKFHHDLCNHVRQLVGSKTGTVPGFIGQYMASSARWQPQVLHALENAPVFVALLSADYLDSPWCGMEWDAFSRRRPVRVGEKENSRHQTTLLPVVWLPVARARVPSAVRAVQRFAPGIQGEAELRNAYLRHGVYGLLAMNSPHYEAVAWYLARLIADLFHTFRVPPGDPLDADQLRNAFERTT